MENVMKPVFPICKSAESENPCQCPMGRLKAFFHSLGHALVDELDHIRFFFEKLILMIPFALWAGFAQDMRILIIPAVIESLFLGISIRFYLKKIKINGGCCPNCQTRKTFFRFPGPV
jgi:hypothetical protein